MAGTRGEEDGRGEKIQLKEAADIPYEKYNDLELKYNKLKQDLLEMTSMYLELKRSYNG